MKGIVHRTLISKSCIDRRHHHCFGFVFPFWKGTEWIPAPETPMDVVAKEATGVCECKCHEERGAA